MNYHKTKIEIAWEEPKYPRSEKGTPILVLRFLNERTGELDYDIAARYDHIEILQKYVDELKEIKKKDKKVVLC